MKAPSLFLMEENSSINDEAWNRPSNSFVTRIFSMEMSQCAMYRSWSHRMAEKILRRSNHSKVNGACHGEETTHSDSTMGEEAWHTKLPDLLFLKASTIDEISPKKVRCLYKQHSVAPKKRQHHYALLEASFQCVSRSSMNLRPRRPFGALQLGSHFFHQAAAPWMVEAPGHEVKHQDELLYLLTDELFNCPLLCFVEGKSIYTVYHFILIGLFCCFWSWTSDPHLLSLWPRV